MTIFVLWRIPQIWQIWVLCTSFIAFSHSSKLNVPKLLLPYSTHASVNFTLKAETGCFTWWVTGPGCDKLLSLSPVHHLLISSCPSSPPVPHLLISSSPHLLLASSLLSSHFLYSPIVSSPLLFFPLPSPHLPSLSTAAVVQGNELDAQGVVEIILCLQYSHVHYSTFFVKGQMV